MSVAATTATTDGELRRLHATPVRAHDERDVRGRAAPDCADAPSPGGPGETGAVSDPHRTSEGRTDD